MIFTGSNCRLMECGQMAGISAYFQTEFKLARSSRTHSTIPNFVSMIDLLNEMLTSQNCGFANQLSVIDTYYSRLAEQRYSHKSIFDSFNQMLCDHSSSKTDQKTKAALHKNLLTKWMTNKYPDSTYLWTVRKKVGVRFFVNICF